MALANVSYTANGAQTDFVVTFDYLSRDDVSVFVDGVDTTDPSSAYVASFQDDTTIRVTAVSNGAAVPSPLVVLISRITDTASPAVVFADGAVVRARALNQNTNQLLFIAQEVKDEGTSRVGLDTDDTFDFNNKRAKNLADPINDQDAATKAHVRDQYNSGIDAGAAKTAAEAARDAAATSQSNAASSAAAASTSESNAASSAASAAADAVTTAADVVATTQDVIDAAASAAAALVSENAASTSETNAASSELSASTDASAASASQAAALVSENAASTSAVDAANSAATATTQAGLSSGSASQAATSESNAASSAAAASTSESNADTSEAAALAAQSASEAARDAAQSARDSALSAFDNFDDKYLGAKASDPSFDNDGDALTAGSLFYHTVQNTIKVYTGSAWVAAYANGSDFAAIVGATFTGNISAPTVTATTSVVLGAYTFKLSGGTLVIANSTTNIAKLDASGNLTVIGDVTAFGTI